MSRRVAFLTARVRRLADALAELRERLRLAIASELGRAVGDALRDLVQTLAQAPTPVADSPNAGWDDDPWNEGDPQASTDDWENGEKMRPDRARAPVPAAAPPVTRLAGAVAVAAAVARWWATRPLLSPWAGATLTALAGAAAWCSGPLAHAALAALTAAADLLALGRPEPIELP